MVGPRRLKTWTGSSVAALGIVAYFVLFTVWLPSWVVHLSAIASAAAPIRDLIGLGVWLLPMVMGIWGLRRLQAMGRI